MRAYIFPGQGSQQVGMGEALCREFPAAKEIFERADEALGFSISALCFEGPAERLMLTANSQPAILTMSVAVLTVLQRETSLRPDIVAGHSLGEYTALVCADALGFEDAVRTVHKRGQFMQAAVPVGQGAMAAVLAMSSEQVEQLCAEAAQGQTLVPSNFNAPQQTVISGHTAAVDRAVALALQRDALAEKLPVSAPFHSPLMQRAAEQLAEYLESVAFRAPEIPIVSNVDAQANSDAGRIASLLTGQVTSPVRWTDCVRTLRAAGVDAFVEVGLGQTLARLIQQIDRSVSTRNVGTSEEIHDAIADFPAHGAAQARGEPDFDDGREVMPDGTVVWPDGLVWDPKEPGAHGF